MSDFSIKLQDIVAVLGMRIDKNGNRSANIRANLVATKQLNLQGDLYMHGGKIQTDLVSSKRVILQSGSVTNPIIQFLPANRTELSDTDNTGLYRAVDGSIRLARGGVDVMTLSGNSSSVYDELTVNTVTSDGNLVLNSSSGVIDFNGASIINASGLGLSGSSKILSQETASIAGVANIHNMTMTAGYNYSIRFRAMFNDRVNGDSGTISLHARIACDNNAVGEILSISEVRMVMDDALDMHTTFSLDIINGNILRSIGNSNTALIWLVELDVMKLAR